jgi:hypothetical protein
MPIIQCVEIQLIEIIYEADALFASEREVSGFGTIIWGDRMGFMIMPATESEMRFGIGLLFG